MEINYQTNGRFTYTNVKTIDSDGCAVYSRFGEYLNAAQVKSILDYNRKHDRGKTNEQ